MMQAAIENTLAADMYALVDWHMLGEQNRLIMLRRQKNFFPKFLLSMGRRMVSYMRYVMSRMETQRGKTL